MSDTNGKMEEPPKENGNSTTSSPEAAASNDSVKEESDKEESVVKMEVDEELAEKSAEEEEKLEKEPEEQTEVKEDVKVEVAEVKEEPEAEKAEKKEEEEPKVAPEDVKEEKEEEEEAPKEQKVEKKDKDEDEPMEIEEEKVEEGEKKEQKEEEKDTKEEAEKDEKKKETKEAKEKEEPKKESPTNGQIKKKIDKMSPKKRDRGTERDREGKENDPSGKLIPDRPNMLDNIEYKRDASNRVKLYVLCDQRIWEDRGTGHVLTYQMSAAEDTIENKGNPMVLVRLEGQNKNMLESRILADVVYQKQQETLIVWSETDMMDLALSFQERSGCEELWQKICEVQGRDPGDADATYDDGDDSDVGELSTTASRLALPPIEIGRLADLDQLIHMHLGSNAAREKMTNAIEAENFSVVPKLCEVFRMCEDLEDAEGLRTFYSIVKNLFMLNRNVVIEMLLDDRNVKEVIGMFEYDPSTKPHKNHREFVFEKAKYRPVLNISSDELRDKIHRLYRAQYIQDACLPSLGLFEENLLSTLGSHVFFCRVDIVSLLQKDKKAMRELFGQMKNPDTEDLRRRDLVLFLKEMIILSSSIPTNGPTASKETFFKMNLFAGDILDALEPCFSSPDQETRATMVDVFKAVVDANAQLVRDFLLKQSKDKEHHQDVLMNILIRHLLIETDVHLTSSSELMLVILKTLLDPETMTSGKTERSDFLHLFYSRCFDYLLKPLLDNVNGGVIKRDDYMTANRLSVILRFLTFCVEHHSYSMRHRCISIDLITQSLVCLKSKHSFLTLSALKLLQRVISVKDDKYIRYLVREKVLDPVMDCFRKNGNRYNVINSAVLHTFDYVKSEDIRPIIKYVVENHIDIVESVNYVKTFKEIKIRYDQHRDREETMSIRSEDIAPSPRSSRRERLDEAWFDEEEDLEVGTISESIEKDAANVSPKKEENSPRKSGVEMFPSVLKRKNAFDDDEAPVFGGSASTPTLNHTDKKIVIKVNSDRSSSRTPSPSSSPRASASPGPSREDEVTSSNQNTPKELSPVNSPAPTVRSLVDYDESDDSDEEETPSPDAVPSSSTGSPESDKPASDGKKLDSPEYNDVSSTCSEEREGAEGQNGESTTSVAVAVTVATTELSRKRTSDGLDSTDAKRSRTEDIEMEDVAVASVSAAVSQA